MNIRPLYDRIVVKRIEERETTHRGIIIPDSAKEKPQEGEVMAIGKGKRLEDGKLVAMARSCGLLHGLRPPRGSVPDSPLRTVSLPCGMPSRPGTVPAWPRARARP